jgi:multiple antibiotic resistance protein
MMAGHGAAPQLPAAGVATVTEQVEDLVRVVALVVATLVPIVNPTGVAPVFLSMTPGASDATRKLLSRKIGINITLLLMSAMFIGSHILGFFGLSLPVVKIAGGMLVIANGWRLISADSTPDAPPVSAQPAWGASEIATRAFYPLTFPLTVGPGSISVAVTLGAGSAGAGISTLTFLTGAVAGIGVVGLLAYLSFRYAAKVVRRLGSTGTVILLRLSAFILVAIGVEIFCSGLAERFPSLVAPAN